MTTFIPFKADMSNSKHHGGRIIGFDGQKALCGGLQLDLKNTFLYSITVFMSITWSNIRKLDNV